MVLPRCAAKAERGRGRSPTPGGTWRTPESLAGQRSVHLVFLLLRIGRQARSGPLPLGFLLLSGLEAAAYLTVTWNPGTRVLTRIIVAYLTGLPGAQCSSAVSSVVSGGRDAQDLIREEAAPAPRSAASSRQCRAARTRRWGEAGA